MTVLRSTTLGFALVLGAAGAHAQSVVSRHIDNEPVETTVMQSPGGTVVTRRPLAAVPASTTAVDETVGAASVERSARRTTHRAVHHRRRVATEHTVTRTRRPAHRVEAARPLALAPAQRQVIYRTLVQQQVIPRVAAAPVQVVPPTVPGYPPFPRPAYPAYQARPVVIGAATTGYDVAEPAEAIDDDYAVAPGAPAQIYPIGAVLPASVAVAPLPADAAVAVPAAEPYSYATVDGRVLLVDPDTNTVVADITP